MNNLLKYYYHKFNKDPKRWYPFLSVFYLTNACNFRCPYCSDGFGKPYYQLSNKVLPATEVLKILKNIRLNCDSVVITGGEPLNYPEFDEVMTNIKSLKYKEIVLTTNGFSMDKHLDAISRVTTLVISLDTLNEQKADQNYGAGNGVFRKIMNNLELAEKYPKRKYDIYISAVLTPGNINDLYEVYEFSQMHQFIFAAAPHLEGVKANKLLQLDDQYYQFFNHLVKEKKKGRKIFGTRLYLEYMRDLKKFECKPFTMLVVSPEGNVFYPCLEMGTYADNILHQNNLHKIMQAGNEKFGPAPQCDNRCHSACALGFGLLLKYPRTMIEERFYEIKGRFQK